MKTLIVGAEHGTNIGGSLLRGGRKAGIDLDFIEMNPAFAGPPILTPLLWRLGDRRPYRMRDFADHVVQHVRNSGIGAVVATGFAPLPARVLRQLAATGVRRLNFLTDDPWNAAQSSRWFKKALPEYDLVFTPRRANFDDLRAAGCVEVHYLPFGYDEDQFFPDPPIPKDDEMRMTSDVFFAGGADDERIPYIEALIRAGLNVRLHGGYWDRYPATRGRSLGLADVPTVRNGLSTTRVGLCLVRRANRDGNSMRTFEVPAVGACPLVEDTAEHRELFGVEGERVMYFADIPAMVGKARWIVEHPADRERMARACHRHITSGRNTYGDRLRQMLRVAGAAINTGL